MHKVHGRSCMSNRSAKSAQESPPKISKAAGVHIAAQSRGEYCARHAVCHIQRFVNRRQTQPCQSEHLHCATQRSILRLSPGAFILCRIPHPWVCISRNNIHQPCRNGGSREPTSGVRRLSLWTLAGASFSTDFSMRTILFSTRTRR